MTQLPRDCHVDGASVTPIVVTNVPIDPARIVTDADRKVAEQFAEEFSALWRFVSTFFLLLLLLSDDVVLVM